MVTSMFQWSDRSSYLWEAYTASCCSFSLYCPFPKGEETCVTGIEEGWVYFHGQQACSKISCHNRRICAPNSEQKKGGTRLQPLKMFLRRKYQLICFRLVDSISKFIRPELKNEIHPQVLKWGVPLIKLSWAGWNLEVKIPFLRRKVTLPW